MVFALLFIATVLLIPFVLWTWVYISAFQAGWKRRRTYKDPQEVELEKLAGELEAAKSKLLNRR